MKFSLKFKPGTLRRIRRKIFYQWIKHYKQLFLVFFLLVLGAGIVQWYYELERYSWTDEEKKAFLDRTVKETAFQEEKFKQALDGLATLEKAHQAELPVPRDLFFGKKEQARR